MRGFNFIKMTEEFMENDFYATGGREDVRETIIKIVNGMGQTFAPDQFGDEVSFSNDLRLDLFDLFEVQARLEKKEDVILRQEVLDAITTIGDAINAVMEVKRGE